MPQDWSINTCKKIGDRGLSVLIPLIYAISILGLISG